MSLLRVARAMERISTCGADAPAATLRRLVLQLALLAMAALALNALRTPAAATNTRDRALDANRAALRLALERPEQRFAAIGMPSSGTPYRAPPLRAALGSRLRQPGKPTLSLPTHKHSVHKQG